MTFGIRGIIALAMGATVVLTCDQASAQSGNRLRGSTLGDGQKRLGVGTVQPGLSQLGYVLADGLFFLPTASFETGANTNPDELFSGAQASPYGLANASGVLGYITDKGATTLALRSTLLQYDEDIVNNSRWDAGLAIDNAYAIMPGTVATFGAYYLRDELNLVPSDNTGGYGQLAYKDEGLETFARLKADQIGYRGGVLNEDDIPSFFLPLVQNEQFNVQRVEGATGFIIGPSARVGVYGELGGANLDYYSQNAENVLDRDATEFWAVAGLRFNLHKTLTLDAGWRFNVRDIEDRFTKDHSSDFFDGRLTWSPSETLQFVAEIDRTLVEPVTTFALVGDKTRYALGASYKPAAEWDVSASLRYEVLDQIGDVQEYEETGGSLAVGYQFNERTVIYGLVDYEHTEEQFSGEDYDRVQVGAGTKVQF